MRSDIVFTLAKTLLCISVLVFLNTGCHLSVPWKKARSGISTDQGSFSQTMHYTFYFDKMNDSIARNYKSYGATSAQSYVTWETCERKGEGMWDWSRWDSAAEVLKRNNLKWVPFLILGPAYSTPDWFRAGSDHFPCRCLEHGEDSKIESLWNPNLPEWIDRFMRAFADRYRDAGMIESVLLGIQGDFGEAIYSVFGGGWTFIIPGVYHNHPGYWCDDPYALSDFRDFSKQRYVSLEKLNKSWGTAYNDFQMVDFPGRKDELADFQKRVQSGDPAARRRWLDFIDWYRGSMTDWADWWISTTRKYFPSTPIYLCTGGDAQPWHGSNFAEQTRIAAKYGAGIRITNEASDYKTNFSYTAWVASAGKHYKTYYGFEPAGEENEKGIIARIYNATAAGANQLFDYPSNVFSTQTRMDTQQKHLKFLYHTANPVVPVALWYPNVSITLNWGGYLEKSALFRDYTDFDFLDETMLHTGALDQHRILVIIQGEVMETGDALLIAEWIKKGGYAIVMGVQKLESVEATPEPEQILFGLDGTGKGPNGNGRIIRVKDWSGLEDMLGKYMSELGYPVLDLRNDSIFTSQIGDDHWLFLNTSSKTAHVMIPLPGSTHPITLAPDDITDIDLGKRD